MRNINTTKSSILGEMSAGAGQTSLPPSYTNIMTSNADAAVLAEQMKGVGLSHAPSSVRQSAPEGIEGQKLYSLIKSVLQEPAKAKLVESKLTVRIYTLSVFLPAYLSLSLSFKKCATFSHPLPRPPR